MLWFFISCLFICFPVFQYRREGIALYLLVIQTDDTAISGGRVEGSDQLNTLTYPVLFTKLILTGVPICGEIIFASLFSFQGICA